MDDRDGTLEMFTERAVQVVHVEARRHFFEHPLIERVRRSGRRAHGDDARAGSERAARQKERCTGFSGRSGDGEHSPRGTFVRR